MNSNHERIAATLTAELSRRNVRRLLLECRNSLYVLGGVYCGCDLIPCDAAMLERAFCEALMRYIEAIQKEGRDAHL